MTRGGAGGVRRWRLAGYAVPTIIGSAVTAAVTWRLATRRREAPAAGPNGAAPAPPPKARDTQADRISTMWGNIPVDGGDTERGLWGAILANNSDAPIRYANLTVRHRRDGWVSKGGFHKVAPHCRLKWSAVKVYANASGGFGPTVHGTGQMHARRSWRDPTLFTVELTFQDAGNRFWLIDEDDEKHELARDLVVWLDDERVATCDTHIRAEFQPKFGVSARFEGFRTAEDLQRTFNECAERPQPDRAPPDVLVGAHDWLGRLAADEKITEVTLTSHQRESFHEKAIRALTRGTQLMGVPYAFDTVALIANRALTGDAPVPRTFAELLAMGELLRRPGGRAVAMQMGPIGDMYHAWAIFSSVGGTMAGLRPDGTYEPPEVWKPNLVTAFERLADLRQVAPYLFDEALSRDSALDLFLAGDTPYLITACGNLGDVLGHGMPVHTSIVPPLGDLPARPLVTVMTFYLPRFGRNRRVAQDLLTYYLARPDTGIQLNEAQPWPPVQREATPAVAHSQPELAGYFTAVDEGVLMPSHPRMREVWDHLTAVQLRIARGEREVASHARDAAEALDGIGLAEWR